jgi:hypothetical protein
MALIKFQRVENNCHWFLWGFTAGRWEVEKSKMFGKLLNIFRGNKMTKIELYM